SSMRRSEAMTTHKAMVTDAPAAMWRYDIQYGPEGEANYAWVYCGAEMVATMRTYNAHRICKAMNAALASPAPAKREAGETAPESHSSGWQDMATAPKGGKHVILAVRTECGCFVYSVQGAFMQGK